MRSIFFGLLLLVTTVSHGFEPNHSFTVKVTGSGPAVILIPGLMCGADVWDATVEHLKGHYTCHVLTLPGFAGVKPIPAPFLSTVRDEIEHYVSENKLERPILLGHSLGGMLALWLASDKPEIFGGVMSLDGVPYLGALADPKQTPASLQPMVMQLENYYKAMDADRLAAANAHALPELITDPSNIAKVLASADKSDPTAIGIAFGELMLTDLRPGLSKLVAPLLLLVPDGNHKPDESMDGLKGRYEAQVSAVPQHQVIVVPKSKHFIMLDAQAFFFDNLDEFLVRTVHRG